MLNGKNLYEAFWDRQKDLNNEDFTYPAFDDQANAIQQMWVNIAEDAFRLQHPNN